jgi:hypothetical protein
MLFYTVVPAMTHNAKTHSGGGAAAVAPPLTFSGCSAIREESAHLQTPKQILLKFIKDTSRSVLPPNLEHKICERLPIDKITIEVTENDKCFKVFVGFESSEKLEKSKSLLKTLSVPLTTKGKTSNWKPEVSVVQPKKSEQKDDSAIEKKEDFPLDVFGDYSQVPIKPMLQHVHKFIHLSIYDAFIGCWQIDKGKWGNLVKLPVYESLTLLGNSSICVPHPSNPEAQQDIVQMQQMGARNEVNRNWRHSDSIWVPREVLGIRDFWSPSYLRLSGQEEIQQPDPATLIAPPASPTSPYPVFNKVVFLESLKEQVHGSVAPQSASKDVDVPCWLTDAATEALFQRDADGKLTPNPKTGRFAQMIEVNAYVRTRRSGVDIPGGVVFHGFKTRVTPPDQLVIVHPTTGIERFVRGMRIEEIPKYNYHGKVLIPHQFITMPEVWVKLERSIDTTWH